MVVLSTVCCQSFQVLRRVGLPGPQQQEREDLVLGTLTGEVITVFNRKSQPDL